LHPSQDSSLIRTMSNISEMGFCNRIIIIILFVFVALNHNPSQSQSSMLDFNINYSYFAEQRGHAFKFCSLVPASHFKYQATPAAPKDEKISAHIAFKVKSNVAFNF